MSVLNQKMDEQMPYFKTGTGDGTLPGVTHAPRERCATTLVPAAAPAFPGAAAAAPGLWVLGSLSAAAFVH